MSFPYTTTSPPPTSGALTVVDRANESQPYAGGGGGGGGGGPNPVVSTLTLNSNGAVLSPTSASTIALAPYSGEMNDGKIYPGWLTSDGVTSTTSFFTGQVGFQGADQVVGGEVFASIRGGSAGDFGITTLVADCRGFQIQNSGGPTFLNVSSINVSTINGALPGGSVPPNLVVSTIQPQNLASTDLAFVGNGGTIVFDQTGDQNIQFNNGNSPAEIGTRVISGNTWLHIGGPLGGSEAPVSISSLTCAGQEVGTSAISSLTVSSINGVVPGGGVGPALSLSSLTASTVTFANTSTSGMFYAADGSLVNKAVGISLTPLTGQYGNSRVVGAWGEEVYGGGPGWAEFATQRLYVTDSQGAATNATYIQNIANTVSVNAPSIVMNGPTSVSSLTVSSINGAAPGGGGGLSFSTIGIPGGAGTSTFNLTASATNLLVSFSTIAGHTYSASVGSRAQFPNAPPAATDTIYSEILDDGVGNEVLGSWPLSQVSTLTAGINQEVGGTINWKAGGTGCAFSLYPTAAGATARVDRLVVIDYGAI